MSAVLSINGVPYTDTFRFLRECEEVIERDVDCVVDKLIEFVRDDETGDDPFEVLPIVEALRLPSWDYFDRWEKRILVRTKRNGRHVSKPKGVK